MLARRKESNRGANWLALAAAVLVGSSCARAQRPWQPQSLSELFGGIPAEKLVARGPMQYLWSKRLLSEVRGRYVPVERAQAALHPSGDRLYVGASNGVLLALDSDGVEVFRFLAGSAIESTPQFDTMRDELYVGDEHGNLYALRLSSGVKRWQTKARGSIRGRPLLHADGVYVATHNDTVTAFGRVSGEELWTYERELPEGFSITSHADLVFADNKLVIGFTDGVVVALDPSDGTVLWERDTAAELEDLPSDGQQRFLDVDSSVVVDGDLLYVASFAAGVFALAASSGSVEWRLQEYVGVTGLALSDARELVLSSADLGIVCVNLRTRKERWRRALHRGSPTPPVIRSRAAWVGESLGGFLAIDLDNGAEVGRIESGHGFSAAPSLAAQRGFVVSNGGTLFAFAIRP